MAHFGFVAPAAPQVAGDGYSGNRIDTDVAGAGVHSSCNPQIAATARHLHVVWQDARDEDWAIYYRRGDASGTSWSESDRRLSVPGSNAVEPRIVASENAVYVVWRTLARAKSPPRESLCATESFDDGATWSDVATLAPVPAEASNYVGDPELVADGRGGACAVWIQAIENEDRALVATHRGAGAQWSALPLALTTRGDRCRASCVRVVAFAEANGGAGHVGVACVETRAENAADLVFRGSVDGGATFPDALTTILAHDTSATALALAANEHGVVQAIWTDLDATSGRACLLAQCSRASGTPGSWFEKPLRADDAKSERASFYDPGIALDAAGDAIAIYTAAQLETSSDRASHLEVVANAFPATASAAEAWRSERVLSIGAARAVKRFVRMRPRVRMTPTAGERSAMAVWIADPTANDARARLWIGTTSDGGSSWSTRPLDGVNEENAPRADHAEFVLTKADDGNSHAAIVWDDRRFWTPPGAKVASGLGAPETCFLDVTMPWSSSRSR